MDDLERIPVRVEYIGGVVSRIVFQSCTGRNVVPGTRGHCGLVEFIDLFLIFGLEAPMNGGWIRLPLLYPEERPFAITKSPQIRMNVFALVRHEEFDIKRLQGRLIEGQRTFDIADSQNHVVEHCSLFHITRASTALSPFGPAWIASGGNACCVDQFRWRGFQTWRCTETVLSRRHRSRPPCALMASVARSLIG